MATAAIDPGQGGGNSGNSGNSGIGGNSAGNSGGNSGGMSGGMGLPGAASPGGPGSLPEDDATLDLARRVRAALDRQGIGVTATGSEEARLHPDAWRDKLAAALADAVIAWLATDGRMPMPAPGAAATAPAGTRSGSSGGTRDETPGSAAGSASPVPAVQGQAPPAAATSGARQPSDTVGFIGDPRGVSAGGAAGVGELGAMLRGWRKERLLPEPGKHVRPEIAIGRDESLDAAFLELLAMRRRAVGIVRTGGTDYKGDHSEAWTGTCSLVAPNILLTNHHVLNSPQVAAKAEVAFDFEVSAEALASGRNTQPAPGRSHTLRPEQLFVTSPIDGGLDYTFVWIDAAAAAGAVPLRMERAAFAIEPGEKAFIIHHPNGKPKRVSLDDADVVAAPPDGPLVHYTTDTEPGTSGAPAFDRSGRLIALHHASRPNREGLRVPNEPVPEYVNEGIKLAAIALDLESRRAQQPSAMIEMVLGEIYGSDTLAGYFGAAGRQVDGVRAGAARVAELYRATDQDIDVGFWDLGWFAGRYQALAGDAASMLVDLGLDVWALGATSPDATAALIKAVHDKFGLPLDCLLLPPGAPEAEQTGALLWNPETVRGDQLPWPDDVAALFRLRGEDFAMGAQPAPAPGDIFARQPVLVRVSGGRGLAFNLVSVDPTAAGDGERRAMAAHILARAVAEMIERHGASHDWVLGGGFDAGSTNAGLAAWGGAGYTPASAQDEAGAALSYLKCPDSRVGPVFLSPNLSRLYGPQDMFVVAREKSQVEYLKRFGEHRPLLLRMSTGAAGVAPEARTAAGPAFNARIDAALHRARASR